LADEIAGLVREMELPAEPGREEEAEAGEEPEFM
jgi:hypothetical protein